MVAKQLTIVNEWLKSDAPPGDRVAPESPGRGDNPFLSRLQVRLECWEAGILGIKDSLAVLTIGRLIKSHQTVTPAKAGVHHELIFLDSRACSKL